MTTLRYGCVLALAFGGLGVGLVSVSPGVASAGTPAQDCEAGKNKEAGRYAFCRQKAEAKFVLTGDGSLRDTRLGKCLAKYDLKWPLLESKASGACPTTGDQTVVRGLVDDHSDTVASLLRGETPTGCPVELTTCNGNLAACETQLESCQNAVDIYAAALALCVDERDACLAEPKGRTLKTGQTTCYGTSGAIPCAGTGQDGELQKGLTRTFLDNGDGTITDTKTGLMWEKLSDDSSIHDYNNIFTGSRYAWATAFIVKIATLNASAFAGHTDWRVPNRFELETLLNLGTYNPAVPPAFNTGCFPGCTVLTCSCTGAMPYWSSTTYAPDTSLAWTINLGDGYVGYSPKDQVVAGVRAVRDGS